MTKRIRVRGIRRKEVDEDKLALAFLMLAKILHEQDEASANNDAADAASQRGGESPREEAK